MTQTEIIKKFFSLEQKQVYEDLEQKLTAGNISNVEFNKKIAQIIDAITQEILISNQDEVFDDVIQEQKTIIIANGDIKSLDQGYQLQCEIGIDGIMIGREIFHNPFVFNPNYASDETGILNKVTGQYLNKKARLELLLLHLNLFEQTWQKTKPYNVLKKYFKIYVQGFEKSGILRSQLMETTELNQARDLVTFHIMNS